jgi:predicted DNA-binding protein YlxM (UPF0122 family)
MAFEEAHEEMYESGSEYAGSDYKNTVYEEAETFNDRPSTARDTTGKLRYVEQDDSGIPEVLSSEGNKTEPKQPENRETRESRENPELVTLNQNYAEDMEKVFKEIEFTYVDASIKQRKWLNRSIMQQRDSSRVDDHRRKEAQNSLRREFQLLEEKRNHNKIHTNKKSRKLAQTALKKKIRSVVNSYSQNGYLAFEHFLRVLYMLQITQNVGRLEEEYVHSDRIKRVKEEKDANELEFALQLWNKINCYLFNYVDSAILVDFLMILLSTSKHKVETAERYIDEISQADDLPIEEIQKNRERNKEFVIDHVWTCDQLFSFYKHKLN